MQQIKHVLGVIILTVCSLAYGIDVDIAGETIRIPSPEGFTDVRSASQDTFSFFEGMCPEMNRLLAVFVTKSDAEKLMRGDNADLVEYMTVQSVKKLEELTLAKYQFREVREMFRKEYDSLFQNSGETIDQAMTQAGSALSKRFDTEVQFNVNGIAPLGVDAETASSISMSQLAKYNLSISGEDIEYTVAGSITAVLIKGKVLYLNAFKTHKSHEDLDWIRSQSAKWLPTIISANEKMWPSSTGGIVPEGTPLNLETKELMSETQVEYNMKLHPKAHGLDVSIKYPESWTAKEAIRPHIVHKFSGNSASGISPFCMLLVHDIPTWGSLLLESELGEDVLIECLSEMVPPQATYLDGGATRIDGEPGAWLKYYYQDERAGMRVGMYTLQYVFFYGGKMLAIQCSVGGPSDDKVMLEDAFTSYLPVFQMIGNSVVIHEKWIHSEHHSFKEHLTGWSLVLLLLVIPSIIALGFGVIRPKKIPTPVPPKPIPPPILIKSSQPPPLPKKASTPPPLSPEASSKNG